MPEGQFTGARSRFRYTADDARVFVLRLDSTLGGLANTGLTAFDPAAPGNAQNKPLRFKPRGVYWQGVLSGRIVRKFIVCGTTTAGLYAATGPQAVEIDQVNGTTTGRRGEKLSYG